MPIHDAERLLTDPAIDEDLRGASAFRQLHWLASGCTDSTRLTAACIAAIGRENPRLNAFVALDPSALGQAAQSDARRAEGRAIGRLDGLTVAIKDNVDVAGLPTTAGLPGRRNRVAAVDASAVARLRAAGAVILGKSNLDEAALGTLCANPHYGAVQNPWRNGLTAGGSSGGSAAAVAAGLASFALGSDTLGSVRVPASHCGIFGLKPTHGEISSCGVLPVARRLDCVGILARSVADLTIVLQVLNAHDPQDPRSRQRRVALATPDWDPGQLRSGVVSNPAALGVAPDVVRVFDAALARLDGVLGQRIAVDLSDFDLARTRRAALLVMESELAAELAGDLADIAHPLSPRLCGMLEYAARKSAVDYAVADQMLDQLVLKARRLFNEIDVLVVPTVPHAAYPLADGERANDTDLTSLASLAGCPAITLPMGFVPDGLPIGLQLVGAPGADLRLLELAEACAATLDATPDYPVAGH